MWGNQNLIIVVRHVNTVDALLRSYMYGGHLLDENEHSVHAWEGPTQ